MTSTQHLQTANYTLEDLSTILQQLRIDSYLHQSAIKNLSKTSKQCLEMLKPHITTYYCYQPHPDMKPPQVYKFKTMLIGKRGLCNNFGIQAYFNCVYSHTTSLVFVDCYPRDFYYLPQHLTHLRASAHFSSTDSLEILPPQLTHLHLEHIGYWSTQFHSNVQLKLDHLPPTLTHLKLVDFGPIMGLDHLPCTLTHLLLAPNFNSAVDHLPSKLTHLILGHYFNFNIDYLPQNLKRLTLGNKFDKNIDHLPPTLTHLYLGISFSKPIDNLPSTLRILLFPEYSQYPAHQSCFNNDIYYLPPSIKILRLPSTFTRSVEYLPSTLKYCTRGLQIIKKEMNTQSVVRIMAKLDYANKPY